jgi:general stress protein YciG
MADADRQSTDHKMSRSEAGRLGGEKVKAERGSEFYSEIGSRDGKENNPGSSAGDTENARSTDEDDGRHSAPTNENMDKAG